MKMRKSTPGFTLIELLVVMGVILILAGIVVGVQRGVYHQQSQARAKADLQAISNALETFKLKYGDYPWLSGSAQTANNTDSAVDRDLFKVLTGQRVLRKQGANYTMVNLDDSTAAKKPVAALIDENLIETAGNGENLYFVDPWGSPYKYYYKSNATSPWNHSGFVLLSLGPDRDMGGASGDGYDFSDGTFPQNGNDYAGEISNNNKKADNLIYGLEIQ